MRSDGMRQEFAQVSGAFDQIPAPIEETKKFNFENFALKSGRGISKRALSKLTGLYSGRYVDKLPCNMHEGRGRRPSMLAFIVAIIVFVLTNVMTILVLFRYGMSDNQSLPPSTAFKTTFNVGTLIACAIAASHWLLPQIGSWW